MASGRALELRAAAHAADRPPRPESQRLIVSGPVFPNRALFVHGFQYGCSVFSHSAVNHVKTLHIPGAFAEAAAEAERLGVPMVFTSDREYNSFGGHIDKAHEGFGTANDPEPAYELACFYGKAMRAVGIHVTFEPLCQRERRSVWREPRFQLLLPDSAPGAGDRRG